MSGWPHLALGTFGAGCAAGGAGLAGLLAATGLDTVEDRLARWGDLRLWELSGGPWEIPALLLLVLGGMAAFGVSAAAAFLWFGEAFEGRNKKRRTALLCASIGVFGWAVTVLHLGGAFDAAWSSDLGPSLPPRGVIEGGLTLLDMTGLVAALTLAPGGKA